MNFSSTTTHASGLAFDLAAVGGDLEADMVLPGQIWGDFYGYPG